MFAGGETNPPRRGTRIDYEKWQRFRHLPPPEEVARYKRRPLPATKPKRRKVLNVDLIDLFTPTTYRGFYKNQQKVICRKVKGNPAGKRMCKKVVKGFIRSLWRRVSRNLRFRFTRIANGVLEDVSKGCSLYAKAKSRQAPRERGKHYYSCVKRALTGREKQIRHEMNRLRVTPVFSANIKRKLRALTKPKCKRGQTINPATALPKCLDYKRTVLSPSRVLKVALREFKRKIRISSRARVNVQDMSLFSAITKTSRTHPVYQFTVFRGYQYKVIADGRTGKIISLRKIERVR